MYSAFKIQIDDKHELYEYFDLMCFNAKNLYNVTNYYIRQVYTALKSVKMNENQEAVFKEIDEHLDKMNEIRIKNYQKALGKPRKKNKKGEIVEPKLVLFEKPNQEKSMIWYEFTEALFKVMKQVDYKSLPSQANQQTMKKVFDDWKSFFNATKEYSRTPDKFLGKPKIPKYKPKDGRTTCFLTNQIVEIKKDGYLKLPGTEQKLHIGKLSSFDGKLQQVRIIPTFGRYEIEIVFKTESFEKAIKRSEKDKNTFVFTPKKIIGVDLGVDNFATIVDNMGNQPMLIKGKWLKSINQYYNKLRANYVGIIRNGKQKNEGTYTTERLKTLDRKRRNRVIDFLHKSSFKLVEMAQERDADTIIIGKNDGWKQEVEMKKSDKQNFIGIPYATFIEMVRYKAERIGIQVVVREESYTSQSSFLHQDPLPIYGEKHSHVFSGHRETRAFYKIKGSKQRIHADVNAAFNIIRKHVKGAFESQDSRDVFRSPKSIHLIIQKPKKRKRKAEGSPDVLVEPVATHC